MRDFGNSILGRAVYDATFNEMTKPYSHAMSVTLAAQAAEIIIKARIAQEHPLLIFENLPTSSAVEGLLGLKDIYEHGRTIAYSDLPDKLWASVGYRIENIKLFIDFGKLRNKIVHLAPPSSPELSDETLRFAFTVVDPMIEVFWDDTIVNYVEVWDDVIVNEGYLKERIDKLDIQISKNAISAIKQAMN